MQNEAILYIKVKFLHYYIIALVVFVTENIPNNNLRSAADFTVFG